MAENENGTLFKFINKQNFIFNCVNTDLNGKQQKRDFFLFVALL